MRLIHFPIIGIVVLVLFASALVAPGNEPAGSAASAADYRTAPREQAGSNDLQGGKKTSERLREGTRLNDVHGAFVALGADSVTFAPTGGKDAYRVLENLALQRVSQQLDENRGPRQWIVSGLITEFRGSNYLLVTKAVVQLQDGDSATDR
jgi:hypothetical protein